MKKIKTGNSFNYSDIIKCDKMIEVKIENNIGLTFLDNSIEDYYADSKLGGAELNMTFNVDLTFKGHFYYDSRIKSIEFGIELKPGFLSWVELWKIIDDLVKEHDIDRCEILHLDLFETEYAFYKNRIIVKPILIGV